jgi:hypothetical protein
MSYGEQAALLGVLEVVKPGVAIEVGTYTGGSLALIAPHAGHVHTLDLVSHVQDSLPNVDYHLGDSRTELPRLLATLEQVDFVLIDGDHERSGVRADVYNVLAAQASRNAVVLMHDVANEGVRAGVRDALRGRDVAYANLSFVPPSKHAGPLRESWGGLGIIVVGDRWRHQRRIVANVGWPTAVQRTLPWHLARPIRAMLRALAYRLRPIVRRHRGIRGVYRDNSPH